MICENIEKKDDGEEEIEREGYLETVKKCIKFKFMWPENLSDYSPNHVFLYFQCLPEFRQK